VAVDAATAAVDPFDAPAGIEAAEALPTGADDAAADSASEPASGAGTSDDVPLSDMDDAPASAVTSFAGAMARDDRFFEPDVLESCAKMLKAPGTESECFGYATVDVGDKLEAMSSRLASISERVHEEEDDDDDDDDVPDEYLCEMMGALMKDPVELPSSG